MSEAFDARVEAAKKYRAQMPYNSCGCYNTDLMAVIDSVDRLAQSEMKGGS